LIIEKREPVFLSFIAEVGGRGELFGVTRLNMNSVLTVARYLSREMFCGARQINIDISQWDMKNFTMGYSEGDGQDSFGDRVRKLKHRLDSEVIIIR
jgi:hypothetical protein